MPIPEDWSAEQALVVYDFCSALQELIWPHYRLRAKLQCLQR